MTNETTPETNPERAVELIAAPPLPPTAVPLSAPAASTALQPPAPQPPAMAPQHGATLDMSPRRAGAPIGGEPIAPYVYDNDAPLAPNNVMPVEEDWLPQTGGVVVMPDGRVVSEAEADAEDTARVLAAAARIMPTAGPPMPMPTAPRTTQAAASHRVEPPRLAAAVPTPVAASPAVPTPTMPLSVAPTAPALPRRSPFRDSPDFCAGSMVIDETRFWYRELLDTEKEWLRARFEWLASTMGITLEAFLSDNYEGAVVEQLNLLPQRTEETFDILLGDCGVLRAWDWPDVPTTPANVRLLAFEVKARIFEQVTISTTVGASADAFSLRLSK